MDKRKLKKLKKEVSERQAKTLRIQKNIAYINRYVSEYLTPVYEEFYKVSRANLEYFYRLYETDTLPGLQKQKLFDLMEETIVFCKDLSEYSKEYSCFLKQMAEKLNISLEEKIIEYHRQVFGSEKVNAQFELRKRMKVDDPKQLIREMQDSLGGNYLVEDDKKIVLEIVDEEEVCSDLILITRYRFWATFFRLNKCLEEMLEEGKPETIFYKKERKRYMNSVKKHFLSRNYIGLFKIYLKIYEAILNGNNDFPVESDNAVKKLNQHYYDFVFPLSFYYTLDIPYRLTVFINFNSGKVKKRLKEEEKQMNYELIESQMIRTAELSPVDFRKLVSNIVKPDESECSLFVKTLFTLDSVLKITG